MRWNDEKSDSFGRSKGVSPMHGERIKYVEESDDAEDEEGEVERLPIEEQASLSLSADGEATAKGIT